VGGGARLALAQVVDVARVELAEAVAGVGDVQLVAVPGDASGVDVDVGVGGLAALHRRMDEENVTVGAPIGVDERDPDASGVVPGNEDGTASARQAFASHGVRDGRDALRDPVPAS